MRIHSVPAHSLWGCLPVKCVACVLPHGGPRNVVSRFCGTLCHEPLFILLFSWPMAYICSKLAFEENAFWIKATTICLTPWKLFFCFWPEWDHELLSSEKSSKHFKDHPLSAGEWEAGWRCACSGKLTFALRETEWKRNKSTEAEHYVTLKKSSKDECSEWRDMELCSKESWSGHLRAWAKHFTWKHIRGKSQGLLLYQFYKRISMVIFW